MALSGCSCQSNTAHEVPIIQMPEENISLKNNLCSISRANVIMKTILQVNRIYLD